MTLPPEIAAEYPILVAFIILVGAVASGGFAFIRWLLAWQEKRDKQWQEFLAASDAGKEKQNEKRDGLLTSLVNEMRTLADGHTRIENKVDSVIYRLDNSNGGKRKGASLQ